tara:strand:- start:66 stop:365 length:300 start_codon:yes stop_codon:yes gene_type:complete
LEQENDNLKETFEKELEKLKSNTILSSTFRRKKTIIWGIRTLIAIILYVIFWEYQLVKWSLIAYIPLNLFSIVTIYGGNIFLNKKIKKTQNSIENIQDN